MSEEIDTSKQLMIDMWRKIDDSSIVMVGSADGTTNSEPLTAQIDDDQPDAIFFFLGKNNRVAGKNKLLLQFVSKGHELFACIRGTGRIDNNRALIDKLWNPNVEAWFPNGKQDPNLALLRVDIDDTELWETATSIAGRARKLFGGGIISGAEGNHASTAANER